MTEIDEILERHPTTCSYEEDARYIYPEILKEVREALAAKEAELAELRKLSEFWEDQSASYEAQLTGANKELAQAREKIESLLSLIDGAKSIVEIYKTHSPAQIRWKSDWLNKAREALK